MKKIVIIGGGSYNWAFGFTRQLAYSRNSADYHLVLHDIDQEPLDLVFRAAEKYITETSSTIKLEKNLDLESSLKGADFILVTITTGGLKAMEYDLAIPEKYGIRHTVGDTVGPGGWSRAIRNIPVFYDISEKIKRICPDAWILNMSNPLTPLTRVPTKYFGLKAVGMCPGVEFMAMGLIEMAGLNPKTERKDFTCTGIDHGSWFTSLYADGLDVLAILKEKGYYRSDGNVPDMTFNDPLMGECLSRAAFAIWREIGYMPTISDRHTVENYPWFINNKNSDDELSFFSLERTPISVREKMFAEMRDKHTDYLNDEISADQIGSGHGNDPVPTVVEALSGAKDFLWTSNYGNIGQVPDIPEGAVVETRCRFDAAGVHPLVSPMPRILKTLTLPTILRQESVVDIAMDGTFDDFAALMTTDPLCGHLKLGEARNLAMELIEANGDFITNPKLFKF